MNEIERVPESVSGVKEFTIHYGEIKTNPPTLLVCLWERFTIHYGEIKTCQSMRIIGFP